jgi:hypothetical protein
LRTEKSAAPLPFQASQAGIHKFYEKLPWSLGFRPADAVGEKAQACLFHNRHPLPADEPGEVRSMGVISAVAHQFGTNSLVWIVALVVAVSP